MRPSPEMLLAAIAARGDRAVLRGGKRSLSGAQVVEQVARRAALLRRHDCRRVALALDNDIDWVLWDLALLVGGRVSVPLPPFFSPAQVRHVLESAGVDAVVTENPRIWAAAGFVRRVGRLLGRAVAGPPPLPAGTSKITYTSGTTGQPRGVCLAAAAMLAVADGVRSVTPADAVRRHLCVLPLAVLLENVAGVYAPLLAGAEVVLPPLHEVGFTGGAGMDSARLLAALSRQRPGSLILMPQLLRLLVDAAEGGGVLPDSLRFVAVGGARVAPALLQRAEVLGVPVFEGYGLSECASVVCLNTPAGRRPGTVGRALPQCELRIAHDGEVWVRGPHLLGYVGGEAHSGEWLATGDVGHIDDGYLTLFGRRTHQFITAWGRNVDPEWVEAELSQQAPIAQAWLHGEALPRNVAVLVPTHPDVTDDELDAAVQAVNRELPDYLRAHRWLRADEPFVAANGLATANGRLRRDALAAYYLPRFGGTADEADLQGEAA
ncbi:AMP-binding protein [Pseudazoarcus pumilus]|uniref:Long-chain acyl-CoA synthetase n=1 Tax=Pseudazoarcus pumilus TaxID=2067960 RepID=A0A2I6S7F4_9RHOO|nr:AMP-binding protein [Pseudazoarcus pumilus]AUN95187.1 long-chain acyl-CoA synthetase [Pseudazoarcus pumilus]